MQFTRLGYSAALALAFGLACFNPGDEDTTGADDTETSGDGDGDGDPTTGDGDPTTGDGDPTTGDGDPTTGDGDPTTSGDGDPTDGPDSDGDGIPDSIDNCPNDPNPNQLDFSGNGIGNVCDTEVFNNVTGTLGSTALATSAAGNCNIPIDIIVTSGELHVQLDDNAAIAGFEIVNMQVADILDKECSIAGQNVKVSIRDFMMANNGSPFPVSVPHSQAEHDAGSIAGDSSGPHPMLSTGTLDAEVNNDPPESSPLELDGTVPPFLVNISGGGSMGTLAWSDPMHVLAMDQFEVDGPFGITITINFQLQGLVGTLDLAP
jgi:hypothetical protein